MDYRETAAMTCSRCGKTGAPQEFELASEAPLCLDCSLTAQAAARLEAASNAKRLRRRVLAIATLPLLGWYCRAALPRELAEGSAGLVLTLVWAVTGVCALVASVIALRKGDLFAGSAAMLTPFVSVGLALLVPVRHYYD